MQSLIDEIILATANITYIPQFDVQKTIVSLREYKKTVNFVRCIDCEYCKETSFQKPNKTFGIAHFCDSAEGLCGLLQITDGCSRGKKKMPDLGNK